MTQTSPGAVDTLFSTDAIAVIHRISRELTPAVSNPRRPSLVAAYTDNKVIVDESAARAAVTATTAE